MFDLHWETTYHLKRHTLRIQWIWSINCYSQCVQLEYHSLFPLRWNDSLEMIEWMTMNWSITKKSYGVAMLFRYFLDLLLHSDQNHTHQTLVEWFLEILWLSSIATLTARHWFSIVFRYFHNWPMKKSQDILQSIVFICLFTLLEKRIWHIEVFSVIQMHWTHRTRSFWKWTRLFFEE